MTLNLVFLKPVAYGRLLIAAMGGLLAALGPSVAIAHPVLSTYIHHHEMITVGQANIDVEVELTFYEMRSLIERRLMDADHDSVITRAEIKDYLARCAGSLETGLRMTVSGRAIDLVPLYDPEIDLLGVDQIVPRHHILRLFYFARTPSWLVRDSEISLVDSLWADVPSVGIDEVNGADGIRVASDPGADMVVTSAGPRRIVTARVLAMPANTGATGLTREAGPANRNSSWLATTLRPSGRALFLSGIGIFIVFIVFGVAVRLRPRKQEHIHATGKTD